MRFRRRHDARVADEIRFHRDRLVERYVAEGMERHEAERRAFLEFGNAAEIQEAVLDARGRLLDDLVKDLRYAIRTLRRNPVFAMVAVLSLSLGIGANTAIFSLVNGVMLRSLPVDEPGRLIQIARMTQDGLPGTLSYPIFEDFRDNLRSVSGVLAHATSGQSIAFDGADEFVTADLVSGEYFDVLRLQPAAGRLLGPADDDAAPDSFAAVISNGYWQRRFGGRPSSIGTSFTIGDRVFTIVGVTPPGYRSAQAGRDTDLFLPLLPMLGEQRRNIGFNTLKLLGRLKPDASVAQAHAEVEARFHSFLQARSAGLPEQQRAQILQRRAAALPAPDGINPLRENLARPLLFVMGIVGLILLLACVNLSGLLLARAAARQRETSIRLAIGAGRARLVRQFLTESLLLALLGGGLGLVMAAGFSEGLFALFIAGRDIELSVTPDWRVLAFTAAASLTACILAGLAPALHAVRISGRPAIKDVRAHGYRRLGKVLIIAQVAMSMVLVVGATLFVGALIKLYAVDPGFESDGVLIVSVRSLQPYGPERAQAVQQALTERLKAFPGIRAASAAQVVPVEGNLWDRTVQIEGVSSQSNELMAAGFNAVAPGYFETLGTPLLSGRDFEERDSATAPPVAIVNQRFARDIFKNESALGRRVTSIGVTYEIVGVVRDAKYQNLRDADLRTMYIPWTQNGGEQPTRYSYLVRVAEGDPLRLVTGLERLVRATDPSLRLQKAVTYDTLIERAIATERVMATLGGLFGLLALVIASLGMFGMLAYQVARRTNELGVRAVLGARRWAVMNLVLREVVGMLATGVTLGAGVALMLTDIARRIVFGFAPSDPQVIVIATTVLCLTGLVAGWLPARRAASVDPMAALRHE